MRIFQTVVSFIFLSQILSAQSDPVWLSEQLDRDDAESVLETIHLLMRRPVRWHQLSNRDRREIFFFVPDSVMTYLDDPERLTPADQYFFAQMINRQSNDRFQYDWIQRSHQRNDGTDRLLQRHFISMRQGHWQIDAALHTPLRPDRQWRIAGALEWNGTGWIMTAGSLRRRNGNHLVFSEPFRSAWSEYSRFPSNQPDRWDAHLSTSAQHRLIGVAGTVEWGEFRISAAMGQQTHAVTRYDSVFQSFAYSIDLFDPPDHKERIESVDWTGAVTWQPKETFRLRISVSATNLSLPWVDETDYQTRHDDHFRSSGLQLFWQVDPFRWQISTAVDHRTNSAVDQVFEYQMDNIKLLGTWYYYEPAFHHPRAASLDNGASQPANKTGQSILLFTQLTDGLSLVAGAQHEQAIVAESITEINRSQINRLYRLRWKSADWLASLRVKNAPSEYSRLTVYYDGWEDQQLSQMLTLYDAHYWVMETRIRNGDWQLRLGAAAPGSHRQFYQPGLYREMNTRHVSERAVFAHVGWRKRFLKIMDLRVMLDWESEQEHVPEWNFGLSLKIQI